jgi:hypothetical protein
MCNDYEQHARWAEYRRVMHTLDLRIPSHESELDLPQADDIRINDTGPVMRAAGNDVESVQMTFSFPPSRRRLVSMRTRHLWHSPEPKMLPPIEAVVCPRCPQNATTSRQAR